MDLMPPATLEPDGITASPQMTPSPAQPLLAFPADSTTKGVFILAVAYALAGWLAHLMAPDTGFPSLVWLPSGIALGVLICRGNRLWSGVWLGGTAINAGLQYLDGTAPDSALLAGVVIGGGAALQAVLGARLVRRFCGEQPSFDSPATVWPFLGLAALLATTVSATVGIGTLAFGNGLPTPLLFHTWLAWWAGDALGVALVTPIVLAFLAAPQEAWRRRRVSLVIPLLSAILAISIAFIAIGRYETGRQRADFERRAAQHAATLQAQLKFVLEAPATITDFYAVHGPFTRKEFEALAARQHARHQGLQALLWVPASRAKGQWVFPPAGNDRLPDLDLASIDAVAEAMARSHEVRGISVSGKPAWPTEYAVGSDTVLSLSPVYWAPSGDAEPQFQGFVVVVAHLGDLAALALPALQEEGISLAIEDLSAGQVPALLWRSPGFKGGAPFMHTVGLELGGREWRLSLATQTDSILLRQSANAWLVYLGGLGFSLLLSSFLLVITGYSARAERLVVERTSDLESARNTAEKASKLLHEAVGSIAQGFTIYDENDRLIVCNEAYLKIYEESRDLIVPGNTFEEIVREGAERGQYQAAVGRVDAWVAERVRQHQQANGKVLEQQLGDGRWLMIVEYRTPSGYIAGNRIDITPIKRAAAQIEDRNAQLDALFSLSPDGFVAFDRNGGVKFANPAFYDMTGIAAEEIVGCDERRLIQALRRQLQASESFAGFEHLYAAEGERKILTLNLGHPCTRSLQVVGALSAASSVGRILYFRDVTREVEINRMKSEFLSHAAHELRTPMTSILGFAELMLLKQFDPARQREILQTIHRQTKWLVDILNELLDLARIEARRGKDFQIVGVDLVSLVQEAAAGLSFDRLCWPVSLNLPEVPACVRGDSAKLRQAVVNILGNAQKYSPDGGAIDVSIRSGDGYFGVEVTDHGLGMTPEQLKNYGERFWRADASGKTPGTGLGISIVKEIAELHGGRLEVASDYGVGTRVTIWLPANGVGSG